MGRHGGRPLQIRPAPRTGRSGTGVPSRSPAKHDLRAPDHSSTAKCGGVRRNNVDFRTTIFHNAGARHASPGSTGRTTAHAVGFAPVGSHHPPGPFRSSGGRPPARDLHAPAKHRPGAQDHLSTSHASTIHMDRSRALSKIASVVLVGGRERPTYCHAGQLPPGGGERQCVFIGDDCGVRCVVGETWTVVLQTLVLGDRAHRAGAVPRSGKRPVSVQPASDVFSTIPCIACSGGIPTRNFNPCITSPSAAP